MKTNSYFFAICTALLVVLVGYDLLHYLKVFSLPIKLFLLINTIIPFLFLIGAWIVTSGKKKEPHVQVNKFVLLTTFQFMTMLIMIAAVWYKYHFALKAFGLQIVSLYVILLFFQSWLILKSVNEEN
jgi:hypothetical protein